MSADSEFEKKMLDQATIILQTDAEYWEKRNKAMLQMTALVSAYRDANVSMIQDVFTPAVFRMIQKPVKALLCDLRSQQVRDTCQFITVLSLVTGNYMKYFFKDAFNHMIDAIKVPNKVLWGFADDCILTVIKQSEFKSCIPQLITEIKDSKSKQVRERCLDYIKEIIGNWNISEKEADMMTGSIKIGLEDASGKGREIARHAYLYLYLRYPKKVETKIKALLPPALKARLTQAESVFMASQNIGASPPQSPTPQVTSIEENISSALSPVKPSDTVVSDISEKTSFCSPSIIPRQVLSNSKSKSSSSSSRIPKVDKNALISAGGLSDADDSVSVMSDLSDAMSVGSKSIASTRSRIPIPTRLKNQLRAQERDIFGSSSDFPDDMSVLSDTSEYDQTMASNTPSSIGKSFMGYKGNNITPYKASSASKQSFRDNVSAVMEEMTAENVRLQQDILRLSMNLQECESKNKDMLTENLELKETIASQQLAIAELASQVTSLQSTALDTKKNLRGLIDKYKN